MKTKYLKYLLIVTILSLFTSCEFLNRDDEINETSGNYYTLEKNIETALVGVYDILGHHGGETRGGNCPFTMWSDILSDDAYAGGEFGTVARGSDEYYANSHQVPATAGFIDGIWIINYKGIGRANLIIQAENDVTDWSSDTKKNNLLAQARFIRAHFYFELVRMFGNIPLITTNRHSDGLTYTVQDYKDIPQANPEDVYKLIFEDLTFAKDYLDSSVAATQYGRATKWAAEALLARVYLFYSGYYNKESITLSNGIVINKANVLQWLEQGTITQGGFDLIPDGEGGVNFVFSRAGEGCRESVFEIIHTDYAADWGNMQLMEGNLQSLMQGPRLESDHPEYYRGWSYAVPTYNLYNLYDVNDKRRGAAIVTQEQILAAAPGYSPDDLKEGNQHTGYFSNKYTTKMEYKGTSGEAQLANGSNERIIRFSDVLLMAAELGSSNAQTYLDRVRTRAGLPSVTVSEDAIRLERRLELAGEGLRYWDLLRYGIEDACATIKAGKAEMGPNYTHQLIDYAANEIKANKRGLMPIPQLEIDGAAPGNYKQNPGY